MCNFVVSSVAANNLAPLGDDQLEIRIPQMWRTALGFLDLLVYGPAYGHHVCALAPNSRQAIGSHRTESTVTAVLQYMCHTQQPVWPD